MSLDTDRRVYNHARFVTACCFSSHVQLLVCSVCILVCCTSLWWMYPPMLKGCAVHCFTSGTPCSWPWPSPQRLSFGPLEPSCQTHRSRGSKLELFVVPELVQVSQTTLVAWWVMQHTQAPPCPHPGHRHVEVLEVEVRCEGPRRDAQNQLIQGLAL